MKKFFKIFFLFTAISSFTLQLSFQSFQLANHLKLIIYDDDDSADKNEKEKSMADDDTQEDKIFYSSPGHHCPYYITQITDIRFSNQSWYFKKVDKLVYAPPPDDGLV